MISRYALAWPQVRFKLEQDGRESFRSSGNGRLADVLVAALGREAARHMMPLQHNALPQAPLRISGYVSAPSLHRSDRSRILLFVNGRHVQDSSLTFAVIQACHTLLMKGRFPLAAIMIALPPEQLDVNVHPAKSEVRFQHPREVFSAVQRAVRNTLLEAVAATPGAARGAGEALSAEEWPSAVAAGAWRGAARDDMFEDAASSPAIPDLPAAPQRPRSLPMLRVIGQVGASFIIAEGPAGMYLIDQHAAHERILYEQFMERQEREEAMAQLALDAQTLELPAADSGLIEANLDLLRGMGLDLEPFGANTFLIRSIPALLANAQPVEVLRAVVEELERGQRPGERTLEERLIRRVCKQAAVKAGTVLSLEEMRGLVSRLERTAAPLTCPHGRPTLLHMSSGQLARGIRAQPFALSLRSAARPAEAPPLRIAADDAKHLVFVGARHADRPGHFRRRAVRRNQRWRQHQRGVARDGVVQHAALVRYLHQIDFARSQRADAQPVQPKGLRRHYSALRRIDDLRRRPGRGGRRSFATAEGGREGRRGRGRRHAHDLADGEQGIAFGARRCAG